MGRTVCCSAQNLLPTSTFPAGPDAPWLIGPPLADSWTVSGCFCSSEASNDACCRLCVSSHGLLGQGSVCFQPGRCGCPLSAGFGGCHPTLKGWFLSPGLSSLWPRSELEPGQWSEHPEVTRPEAAPSGLKLGMAGCRAPAGPGRPEDHKPFPRGCSPPTKAEASSSRLGPTPLPW